MNLLLKCRALMLLTGLLVMGSSSWAQDNRIFTQQELMHDARQLASILEQSHPDPYINGGGKIAFQRKLQSLLEDIPSAGMSADEFYPLLLPIEAASNPDEIVCRREKQTGSKMSKRVCRTRAEIEARAAKDQETLRQSRATQTGSECVLNGSC